MKIKKSIIFFGFICLVLPFYAYTRYEQEIFLQANKWYEQHDFNKARDLYESIEQKGPAVWYNMGLCLHKLNDNVQALICLKRAQKDATLDQFAKTDRSIGQLLARTFDKGQPSTQSLASSFYTVIYTWIASSSLLMLQIFFLLFWYCFFFLLFRYAYALWYKIVVWPLFFTSILFGIGTCAKYKQEHYSYGIVTEQNVALLAGPDAQYHKLGQLDIIDQVEILEKRSQWYKVRNSSQVGWAESRTIEII